MILDIDIVDTYIKRLGFAAELKRLHIEYIANPEYYHEPTYKVRVLNPLVDGILSEGTENRALPLFVSVLLRYDGILELVRKDFFHSRKFDDIKKILAAHREQDGLNLLELAIQLRKESLVH